MNRVRLKETKKHFPISPTAVLFLSNFTAPVAVCSSGTVTVGDG